MLRRRVVQQPWQNLWWWGADQLKTHENDKTFVRKFSSQRPAFSFFSLPTVQPIFECLCKKLRIVNCCKTTNVLRHYPSTFNFWRGCHSIRFIFFTIFLYAVSKVCSDFQETVIVKWEAPVNVEQSGWWKAWKNRKAPLHQRRASQHWKALSTLWLWFCFRFPHKRYQLKCRVLSARILKET